VNPTKIEWCTITDDNGRTIKRGYTWNPIVGCTNRCGATPEHPEGWCYARRIARTRLAGMCDQFPEPWHEDLHGLDPEVSLCGQFFPHLHAERLDQVTPRQKPRGIFVGSMADMWDPWVKREWRVQAMDAIYEAPQHTCWALTKRPEEITHYDVNDMPDNLWLGVSVTCQDDLWRIDELIKRVPGRRFVSVEPMMGPVGLDPDHLEFVDWVIIGGMTGPGAVQPERAWVQELVTQLEQAGIPRYLKDNLRDDQGGPIRMTEVFYNRRHPEAMWE